MKKIQFIISLFVLAILTACTDDGNDVDLNAVNNPTGISVLATIPQDNSGKVTFTPRGEGVTQYEIYFGDGTEDPVYVYPGESTPPHVYGEGVWPIKIIATTLNGKKTEVTQNVEVSFIAPTDVKAEIENDPGDNYSINVSATANFETYFQIYFGDVENEEPVDFMQGETISHTYAELGTYEVRVVALSGGVATTEIKEMVIISNPVVLPLTFESVIPVFSNFGGAEVSATENGTNADDVNSSTTVGEFIKTVGAEVWAGTTITLVDPIDFSKTKIINMKVWSPKAGITVLMKLQTLTAAPDDPTNIEVSAISTVTNGWEELSFDFSSVDTANEYVNLVLFLDFGQVGDGTTYYFDDIKLFELALPINFEYPTVFTGDFGGASTVSVANTLHNDLNNSSANVGAATKTPSGEVWGGSYITLDNPIDFSVKKKITMKVWSDEIGTPMLLKVENLTDPGIAKEVIVPTTVAGAWETLTFDFTDLDLTDGRTYQKVVLIFNIGTKGSPTTFYFDDIQQSN